jgi:16S rRNA processing protein RimM
VGVDRPVEPRPGFTALARILRPHGLRGELRVQAFNPQAPNLRPGVAVYAGERQFSIRSIRMAGDQWIVVLDNVRTREDAEPLRGLLMEVPDASIRPEAGAFFIHDLIGMEVSTASGESLGRVREVLQPGANDVYVVEGPRGEVLIPAIGDVVQEIDPERRRIIITPLPGLLNESL